jgi:hypothetical protein
MKQIIFLFLLFSLNASAQIKLDRVQVTSDTTLTLQDTVYWDFSQVNVPRGDREVTLYQADLIVIKGGQITIPKTIGPYFIKDYLQALRDERDQNSNEAIIVRQSLDRINERRIKIVEQINLITKR